MAAGKIGANNWKSGRGCITRRRGGRKEKVYQPTAAHRAVVEAMPALAAGKISPEDATALLWTWEVATERGVDPG